MQSSNIHASICRWCMLFTWLRIIITISYSAYTVNALNKVPPHPPQPPDTRQTHRRNTGMCNTKVQKCQMNSFRSEKRIQWFESCNTCEHHRRMEHLQFPISPLTHCLRHWTQIYQRTSSAANWEGSLCIYVFIFWLCNTYCISSLSCPRVPQVKTHLRAAVKWPQRFRSKRRAWTCRLWWPPSTHCSRRRPSYRRRRTSCRSRRTSCRPNWPPLKVHTALCVSTSSSLDWNCQFVTFSL